MRKILYIIILSPVLLLSACKLQMPTSVQVKGSPELRFSAKFDIGNYLEELHNGFQEEKDDIVLLDCKKTDIVTYLVYMKLYDKEIPLDGLNSLAEAAAGNSFTIPNDINLIDDNLEVPALDFGEFLDGFSFDKTSVKSKLYISGSQIVNGLSVELKVDNKKLTSYSGNKASDLKGKNAYDKIGLPDGGVEIDLPFDGDEFKINYIISAKSGEFYKEWMNDPSVLIEIAVWLPFNFTANHAGAEVKLPDDLFPEGDLFGRESPNSDNTVTEMLESLSFAIKMNKNPFTGAKLNVTSTGINIENPIGGASLEFAVNEQNMKAINTQANFPFAPKLKLVFDKSGGLSFPRNFVITEISFKAKLNHTIDLSKGIN